jgi:hypothetical protein
VDLGGEASNVNDTPTFVNQHQGTESDTTTFLTLGNETIGNGLKSVA